MGTFTTDDKAAALRAYEEAIGDLVAIYESASRGDGTTLVQRPGADAWSVAEIVHHLADTELTHGVRLRRMLTEESPTWGMWDEKEYDEALLYRVRPAADSLALVQASRNTNLRLLEALPLESWSRTGVHPTYGPLDVAGLLHLGNDHLADHLAQARRAAHGRP